MTWFFRRALRSLCGLALIAALWMTSAHASVMLIEVDAASQSRSPLTFELEGIGEEYVSFTLKMPASQPALMHHWRTDVWRLADDGGAALVVPLALEETPGGVLEGRFMVKRDQLGDIFIVVRTGEHAPLAETHIRIDVGSFAAPP